MSAEPSEEAMGSSKEHSAGSGCIGWIVKGVLGLICLFVFLFLVPIELVVHLIAGWVLFVINAVPQTTVRWEAIVSSLLVLALALVFLNRMGRRFIPMWSLWNTIAVTAVVLVLFASAICGTGIGHQLSWLGRDGVYDSNRIANLSLQGEMLQWEIGARQLAEESGGVFPDSLSGIDISIGYRQRSKRRPWGAEYEGLVYLGKGMDVNMKSHLPLIVTPRPLTSSGHYLVRRLDGKADKLDPKAYLSLMDEWRSEMSKRSKGDKFSQ